MFLATDVTLPGAVDWVMMQSCFGSHFMLVLEKQEKFDGHVQFFAGKTFHIINSCSERLFFASSYLIMSLLEIGFGTCKFSQKTLFDFEENQSQPSLGTSESLRNLKMFPTSKLRGVNQWYPKKVDFDFPQNRSQKVFLTLQDFLRIYTFQTQFITKT